MSTTKELWQQLVQHGQLCHRSVSEWHALAGSRREQLFREAQATPPLTYSPVSLENKNLLRSYHAQGLLPGFHPEDFADLNSDEADFLIRCAEENRWLTADSLSDHYCRTARDTMTATFRKDSFRRLPIHARLPEGIQLRYSREIRSSRHIRPRR